MTSCRSATAARCWNRLAVLAVALALPGTGCTGGTGGETAKAASKVDTSCWVGPPAPALSGVPSALEAGGATRVWTRPGDPIRLLCPEPCPIEEPAVRALFSGMLSAQELLVAAAGLDVLPDLVPVDVHLAADTACPWTPGVAGWSTRGPDGRGLLCLFTWEWSRQPPPYIACPLEPDHAGQLRRQLLFVHEYAHALFFGRHEASYEGMVSGLAFFVTGEAPNACDPFLDDIGAHLPYQLCTQAGFDWGDLAPVMQALEALYQAGQGEMPAGWARPGGLPPTSGGQFREVLDARLGIATLDAFLRAGEPPYVFLRAGATVPAAGGRAAFYPRVALEAAPGAVPFDLEVRSAPVYELPYPFPPEWANAAFADGLDLGASIDFAAPVQVTLRYDPTLLPPGAIPAALRIWTWTAGGAPAPLAPGLVDAVARTVSAPIQRLGSFVVGPPPG